MFIIHLILVQEIGLYRVVTSRIDLTPEEKFRKIKRQKKRYSELNFNRKINKGIT